MRHLAQSFFAEQRQMHGRGQRAERLIGADVRSGFLAPNVLFAGRESEHEAATSLGVDGLSRETPGIWRTNLSREARYADERSAVARQRGRNSVLP